MRYLPTEKWMLAFGGPQSVESALKIKRVLPAQRRWREAYRGGLVVAVITASSSREQAWSGGRLPVIEIVAAAGRACPSSIALPGLREGAAFS